MIPKAEALDSTTEEHLWAIAATPDNRINLSDPDAPEMVDWSVAVRGRFSKPVVSGGACRVSEHKL
jgi:hypothetical protein